jgi:hypothetical protein
LILLPLLCQPNFDFVTSFVSSNFDFVTSFVSSNFDFVTSFVSSNFDFVTSFVSSNFDFVTSFVSSNFDFVTSFVSSNFDFVTSFVSSNFDFVTSLSSWKFCSKEVIHYCICLTNYTTSRSNIRDWRCTHYCFITKIYKRKKKVIYLMAGNAWQLKSRDIVWVFIQNYIPKLQNETLII